MALGDRVGTLGEGDVDKLTAFFVDEEAGDAGFIPGKNSKGIKFGGGVEEKVLAGELDENDVVVELGDILKVGKEEALVARRDENLVGFETGSPRQTNKDVIDFAGVAVIALEDIFDVVVFLDLFALPFLTGAIFVRKVADGLDTSVKLTSLVSGESEEEVEASTTCWSAFFLLT
ncbi:MAG: hypothetical protein WBD26_03840 [Candidatus Acidiferrales bacterium]